MEYHAYLASLDFTQSPVDLEVISDDVIKDNIKKVLENTIMKNLVKAKTFKEHEFIFDDGKSSYHGKIDLLAIYKDHIDIIDYKYANIEDVAYDKQLSIYKKYVESIYRLPVNCYLRSLLRNHIRKVDL